MMRYFLTIFAALAICWQGLACQAITKSGKRCSRSQEPYCWQHGGDKKTSSSSTTQISSTSQKTVVKEPKSYQVYQQRKDSRFFSQSMKQKKYNEQNGVCNHCKGHFTIEEMEGDHIKPYSKGGETTYENLQMLCRPCNRKKGNRYDY